MIEAGTRVRITGDERAPVGDIRKVKDSMLHDKGYGWVMRVYRLDPPVMVEPGVEMYFQTCHLQLA